MKDSQTLLIRITCLFWIMTKLLSYRAWLAHGRQYPVVPPFEFLDVVPPVAHAASFFLSLSGLVLLFIFPRKTGLMVALLTIILFSCLLDVVRWQPWEYQCLFFLIIFIINRHKPAALFSAIIFVMGCIYIYSGIHKLNGGYLFVVWEQLILRRIIGLSKANIAQWNLHYIGLIMPIVETLAGVLLITVKNKKIPLFLLMAMHVLLLFMLSAAGISKNRIVLPWNVFMMLILTLYYYRGSQSFSLQLVLRGPNLAILLFWGILPSLHLAGYWDKKLSASMYSGNMKFMDVCVKNPETMPGFKRLFTDKNPYNTCTDGEARLSLSNLSAKEFYLLPYPEYWYYRKFKKKWEKLYPQADMEFRVYQYPYKEVVEIE
ncbi:hypothetical protein [Flavobacterium sp.]|uniref:hypothetical protein n=1 Tax=Flavobacterium sp. TaxID=239 RepID=UPI004034D80A